MGQVTARPRILPTHLVTEGTAPEGWSDVLKLVSARWQGWDSRPEARLQVCAFPAVLRSPPPRPASRFPTVLGPEPCLNREPRSVLNEAQLCAGKPRNRDRRKHLALSSSTNWGYSPLEVIRSQLAQEVACKDLDLVASFQVFCPDNHVSGERLPILAKTQITALFPKGKVLVAGLPEQVQRRRGAAKALPSRTFLAFIFSL